jgi:hypothetical protein
MCLRVWLQEPLAEWLGQPTWETELTEITNVVHLNNTNVSRIEPYYTLAYAAVDPTRLFHGATSRPGWYTSCLLPYCQNNLIAIAPETR